MGVGGVRTPPPSRRPPTRMRPLKRPADRSHPLVRAPEHGQSRSVLRVAPPRSNSSHPSSQTLWAATACPPAASAVRSGGTRRLQVPMDLQAAGWDPRGNRRATVQQALRRAALDLDCAGVMKFRRTAALRGRVALLSSSPGGVTVWGIVRAADRQRPVSGHRYRPSRQGPPEDARPSPEPFLRQGWPTPSRRCPSSSSS